MFIIFIIYIYYNVILMQYKCNKSDINNYKKYVYI